MNAVDHEHGSSPPLGNASDVTQKANMYIWSFFVVCGILLYAMISAVNLYFRFETEREEYIKVGSVVSAELLEQKAEDAAILSGQRTPSESGKSISIDAAVKKMLTVIQ